MSNVAAGHGALPRRQLAHWRWAKEYKESLRARGNTARLIRSFMLLTYNPSGATQSAIGTDNLPPAHVLCEGIRSLAQPSFSPGRAARACSLARPRISACMHRSARMVIIGAQTCPMKNCRRSRTPSPIARCASCRRRKCPMVQPPTLDHGHKHVVLAAVDLVPGCDNRRESDWPDALGAIPTAAHLCGTAHLAA